jgi:hypothetical protein
MILLLLMTTALAEEPTPIIVYKQETEIDFEAIDIEGQLVKPEGTLVQERQEAVFNPLIRLRMDWDEEISQSVSEIK